jgi:HAD superfamily hydrolase (TIGR01549 family)
MRIPLQSPRRLLVLDAMGVIYAEADDGFNLLYPFIMENGVSRNIEEIIRLYNIASIGKMSSAEFWRAAGVNPALEEDYLQRHRLSEGLMDFLVETRLCGIELWCLSNDVSEWSQKLRDRFELTQYFQGFVISGDVGSRKPDPAIYKNLLLKMGCSPQEVVFVDDRLRNIEAANALGIHGILFNPVPEESRGHGYPIARTFSELRTVLDCRRID